MESKCPQCGKAASTEADNKSRPFCSERCRLLDLGSWLSGSYAIAGEPAIDPTLPGDEDDPVTH